MAEAPAAATERVRSALHTLEQTARNLQADLDAHTILFKLVAEDLEREHDSDSVEKLSQGLLEVISCSNHLEHHSSVLRSLSQTFQAGPVTTNFQSLLGGATKLLQEEAAFNPQTHSYFQQFKQSVWALELDLTRIIASVMFRTHVIGFYVSGVLDDNWAYYFRVVFQWQSYPDPMRLEPFNIHHAGEAIPGQEQDEIVMISSQFGVKNKTCPLSGKPIIELEDPVRSKDCLHIYDNQTVMAYIRQHRGRRCKCAAAGCPKALTVSILVCDPSLKMEIQELRLREKTQTQTQVADFTEVDGDDDDDLEGH